MIVLPDTEKVLELGLLYQLTPENCPPPPDVGVDVGVFVRVILGVTVAVIDGVILLVGVIVGVALGVGVGPPDVSETVIDGVGVIV